VKKTAAVLGAFLAGAASGQAQAPAQPPPCAGPEFRTLDFWVGDWIAMDTEGRRIGTNHITRDEYGQCVITEHFKLDDGSMTGLSVSMYRPEIGQWRQTWVDSQGSHFDFFGGPVRKADHTFFFENKRTSEKQKAQRMIFQDVAPDSFTWRWQSRPDPNVPWADAWVIKYKRSQAAGGSPRNTPVCIRYPLS
jgi:hypothetical protein